MPVCPSERLVVGGGFVAVVEAHASPRLAMAATIAGKALRESVAAGRGLNLNCQRSFYRSDRGGQVSDVSPHADDQPWPDAKMTG